MGADAPPTSALDAATIDALSEAAERAHKPTGEELAELAVCPCNGRFRERREE
jgi:hypothetical protein